MKATRWFFNVLLSLFMCMSMVFQSPAPVIAQGPKADENQPVKKYMHMNLSEEIAKGNINVIRVTPSNQNAGQATPKYGPGPKLLTTTTIMTEGFESNFPTGNSWALQDSNETTDGEYLWGPTTKRFRSGAKSGWEAAGGANGYDPSTNPKYPAKLKTAMIYGPFDLTDAVAAKLTFWYWANAGSAFYSESLVAVMASIDNNGYDGFGIGGNNQKWETDYIDFAKVDGQSLSYLGKPQVWILFGFQTDSAAPTMEGIYLDDILLTKDTDTPPVCYELGTTIDPSGSGSIAKNPNPNCENGTKYTAGTTVTLTANASAGYQFGSWSGAVTGSTNPAQVVMDSAKSVTANFVPEVCYSLTKAASGSGSVSVDKTPDCSDGTRYRSGTQIKLTATPNTGNSFTGWTGDVTGTTNPVTVTMNANKTITANFTPLCYTLNTGISPSGSGSVAVDKAPNCNGGTQYTYGTQVKLTATPENSTWTFSSWSGSGTSGSTNPLTVTMDGDKSITANFSQVCYSLTTGVSPSGTGTVNASPAANCGTGKYISGTEVTLTATANTGYKFSSWSGDVTGSTSSVTVVMTGNKSITANFADLCYTLTTAVTPTGGGTVNASVPANCNNNSQYRQGTQLTLTANASAGHSFDRWSGDSTATTAQITVTMDGNKSFTANFTTQCYTLTTAVSPDASGSVAVDKAPNCNGGTQYTYGTQVKLTAAAANNTWAFSSWSGSGTSGSTNPLTVTIDGNKTITANFTRVCYTLTKGVNPTGGGTLAANLTPNCNNNTQYINGTSVTLTASPSTGYDFTSWTGATSSTNQATVTMDGNKTVTANFTLKCYTLTTPVDPAGKGKVDLSPARNCNSGKGYSHGTKVTLTASATDPSYYFGGWTGDVVSIDNPLMVTMDGSKSITATFTQEKCFTLATSVLPAGGGTITPDKQPNCSNGLQYKDGTTVKLTEIPNAHYTFEKWGGDASGSTTSVTVTMTVNRAVTASFIPDCFSLTTAVSPAIAGTVSASLAPNCPTDAKLYAWNTKVDLTAAAKPAYKFDKWTGNVSGSINPVTVTIDGNKTITANFVQKACYTLTKTASPSGSGTVSVSPAPNCPNGTQYTEGTVVQLTAAAGTGYAFDKWSGDASGVTNPVSVTMTSSRSVTAIFLKKNPTPALNTLNPVKIKAGSKDSLLTLTGTGFISGCVIRWNGEDLSGITWVSGTELRVTIPAAKLAAAGKMHITVFNPGPGGGTSNTIDLEIYDNSLIYLPYVRK